MFEPWMIAPIAAGISIIAGLFFYRYVNKQDTGTPRMVEISGAIKEGAKAFLKREYKILAIFVVLVGTLIGVFLPQPVWTNANPLQNLTLSLAYLFGAFCSALAGYFGMDIATKANAKAAYAARGGLNKAFPIGFRGGAVMGLAVVGFSLLGISVVYGITGMPADMGVPPILAFSFGASGLALFAKAGGGIFTKTADISADLVGKVELGIPEDDPRNPAVIADNVGDNVGDGAGRGADLYESYVGSIVAPVALGAILFAGLAPGQEWKGMVLPLACAGVVIICAILPSFIVRAKTSVHPGRALSFATYGAAILTTIATYFLVTLFLKDTTGIVHPVGFFIGIVAGLFAGMLIGQVSEFYTSDAFPVVKNIAKSSQTGAATNILPGMSSGMASTT